MPRLLRSGTALGQRRASAVCRGVLDALLAVTLAPRCAACACTLESPLAGPVCGSCWTNVRLLSMPFCLSCGDPLPSWRVISTALARCGRCRRHPRSVDVARSAGLYEGTLREIVRAFKYEGRRSLAVPLARMMRTAGADILDGADAVVPVPLHQWRWIRRGYNQADDLARQLRRPVVHALSRRRATAAQTGLTAAARRRNVRGAFRLSRLLSARQCHTGVRDRVVVLVDDVRTTGATLDACAAVLKSAGAREVRALTAALAPRPARAGTVSSP